ncbi:peptide-methionine (S)-S-oxide reductase MsrA [Roseibium sp. TrichSKD4]|uniref:peptide-methionine (S)-S-oxide reductase MsrA n=1 Tax=Roseibium sp. TrichSKD4 TaxID=744980 RepID=UPI00058C0543|nr:peptide-methionine (S)-S-oxide reductase MsrA [Roseibium sp. TrichSKD4]
MSFMTMLSRKFELPKPNEALPGRSERVCPYDKHAKLGRPLLPPYPDSYRSVILGMGSFWAAEALFWSLQGIYVTAVGFSGGHTPNPTYNEVGTGRTGHAEVVQVVYDPDLIALEDILKIFWEGHNPTQGMRQGNDVGTQYRSLVLVDRQDDLEAAAAAKERYQRTLNEAGVKSTITTVIDVQSEFYFAEDYHQQYLIKNQGADKAVRGLQVPFE